MEHKTKPRIGADPLRVLTFMEALRAALIRLGIAVCLFAVSGTVLAEPVLAYFVRRTGVRLAAYGLPDPFLALVTLSLGIGMAVTMPYLFYALLAPLPGAFAAFSRRDMRRFWFASILLFYLGALFCLTVTLPYGVRFLLSFETQQIQAWICVRRFVSFCLLFVFGFGFVFELPLAMMVLGRIGLADVRKLAAGRRYAVLAITLVAAVLTPTPDVFNMALMAVPLYLLYEIGLVGMRLWPAAGQRRPLRPAKART